ncbi:MAG: hypothetical protein LBP34_01540 [Flavobacteriaceae bacterium]|jgi:hypothetical protein|nr:hypothetical protein [Flavobacteriaceae bacterium]
MKKRFFKIGLKIGLFALWILVVIAGLGTVVRLLWNWLMPDIFGLAVINFWQALGLLVLFRLLFGSFGHKPGRHARHNLIRDKWLKMTSEEREEFINKKRHWFFRKHPFGRHDCCGKGDFDPEVDNVPEKENE